MIRPSRYRQTAAIAAWAMALTASVGVVAHAQPRELAHAGLWSAYSNTMPDGRALCGIASAGDDGRRMAIEQPAGQTGLVLSLDKPSWSIPPDTPIDLAVRFDARAPHPEHGAGNGERVQVTMPFAETVPFMRALRTAQVVEIGFPAGSEPAWHGGLAGSSRIIDAFNACRNDMARMTLPQPTQPLAATPASSAPGVPTQPFTAAAPAASAAPRRFRLAICRPCRRRPSPIDVRELAGGGGVNRL